MRLLTIGRQRPGVPPGPGPMRRLRRRTGRILARTEKDEVQTAAASNPPSWRCNLCGSEAGFEPLDPAIGEHLVRHGFPYPLSAFETLNVEDYGCPKCDCTDRDRLMALFLKPYVQSLQERSTRAAVVEFAPSAALRSFFKRKQTVINYRCADLSRTDVDDQADLTDLGIYADGQFDLVICSHVLEHVDDDRKAMSELFRILTPGGRAVVLVPLLDLPDAFDEDPSVVDEGERWRRFAQFDHLRLYSKPVFLERLRDTGFHVEELGADHFGAGKFAKHGITKKSVLYVLTRPALGNSPGPGRS